MEDLEQLLIISDADDENVDDGGVVKLREKSKVGLTRGQLFIVVVMILMEVISSSAMSILAPFFPLEAEKKGMSTTVTGLLIGVFPLVIFLFSPLVGILVSYYGPKRIMCIGITLAGTCNILFGLSMKIESFFPFTMYCFTLRILEGIGTTGYHTAGYAIFASLFPNNMEFMLSMSNAAIGIGMSFGPPIGSLLYDYGGFGLPFYTLGATFLLTAPLSIIIVLPCNSAGDKEQHSVQTLFRLLQLGSIKMISIIVALLSTMWTSVEATLAQHLKEFDLSAKQLGLVFLLMAGLWCTTDAFVGFGIVDRITRKWQIVLWSLLGCGISLLILGPSILLGLKKSIGSNLIGLSLFSISYAPAELFTYPLMLKGAIENGYADNSSTYGLIGGLWLSMHSLGEILGPVFGSYLVDNYGYSVSSTIFAGYCLISAIAMAIYYSSYSSQRRETLPTNYSKSVNEEFDI